MTRNGAPPAVTPKSMTVTALGWRTRQAATPSRRNRAIDSALPVASARSTFTATRWSRPRWRARNTLPNAPEPIIDSSRYLPASTVSVFASSGGSSATGGGTRRRSWASMRAMTTGTSSGFTT